METSKISYRKKNEFLSKDLKKKLKISWQEIVRNNHGNAFVQSIMFS